MGLCEAVKAPYIKVSAALRRLPGCDSIEAECFLVFGRARRLTAVIRTLIITASTALLKTPRQDILRCYQCLMCSLFLKRSCNDYVLLLVDPAHLFTRRRERCKVTVCTNYTNLSFKNQHFVPLQGLQTVRPNFRLWTAERARFHSG